MKAIAIDFETANEMRASACAVGRAWCSDGEVVRIEERLIRPRKLRFSPINSAIHGICADHVRNSPELPDVLAEFSEDLIGATLIAHNAAFDMSVLRAALDDYGEPYPECSYLCSLKVAKRTWPDLSTHKLNAVAEHLGIPLHHHVAGEDAAAAAKIVAAASRAHGARSISELACACDIEMGRLFLKDYFPCTGGGAISRGEARALNRDPIEIDSDMFLGLTIVFTGALERFSRDEAHVFVVANGGKILESVSKKVDYVVVGLNAGAKLVRARELGIRVLTEEQWLNIIGGGSAA